ncbi:hypothetical protein BGZ76_000970 [Entomortierella beljakovae]|nr:hypothetical protein BGZ76_000970 [Entomortierella beljakovae]
MEQKKDRLRPIQQSQTNQNLTGEDVSSDTGDDGSDEDNSGRSKEKKQKSAVAVPSKRRLRSSRLMPSVVAHIAADSDGLTIDQLLDEYSEEQQVLRANAGAAEALTRLFRQGIKESESINPDMVDVQDYELIRHTFGDIEDLNLNLTGALTALDDSSAEDDELTKELKRKHRKAKHALLDASADYKAAKRSMAMKLNAELDKEEAQIRAGTHPELLAELKAIEERRQTRINTVSAQKEYFQRMYEINFQAVCKAAGDQYLAGKIIAHKNIKDMVRYRMNRIRQELAQDKNASSKLSRRMVYVKSVEADEYNSCGESCSSFDSYSSSGSECSDCEVCKPPRHLRVPQLRQSKGLSRREVALDISFLYPESTPISASQQYRDEIESLDGSSSGHTKQYSLDELDEDERAYSRKSGKNNQQYLIDLLNDERRKKKRISDRELHQPPYNSRSASDRRIPGDNDMDVDPEVEFIGVGISSSRPSSTQFASRSQLMDYRPRFLPGFSYGGMESSERPLGSSLDPRNAGVERYSQPPRLLSASSYPTASRGPPRIRDPHLHDGGSRLYNLPITQKHRVQERHDAAYRPRIFREYSDPGLLHTSNHTSAPILIEDEHPYETEKSLRSSMTSPRVGPTLFHFREGVAYQSARGYPHKNPHLPQTYSDPVLRRGYSPDRYSQPGRQSASPIAPSRHRRSSPPPVNGTSSALTSIRRSESSKPTDESYMDRRPRTTLPYRRADGTFPPTSPVQESAALPSKTTETAKPVSSSSKTNGHENGVISKTDESQQSSSTVQANEQKTPANGTSSNKASSTSDKATEDTIESSSATLPDDSQASKLPTKDTSSLSTKSDISSTSKKK